jgi:hypothetical protein
MAPSKSFEALWVSMMTGRRRDCRATLLEWLRLLQGSDWRKAIVFGAYVAHVVSMQKQKPILRCHVVEGGSAAQEAVSERRRHRTGDLELPYAEVKEAIGAGSPENLSCCRTSTFQTDSSSFSVKHVLASIRTQSASERDRGLPVFCEGYRQ